MATAQNKAPQLIGETVTVNYVVDPVVGHGQFRLINFSEIDTVAAVKSAWLELGDRRLPLVGVTVFDLDRDLNMDPENFKANAGATVTFLLGFPEVAHEPRFGESCAVGIQLTVNDTPLQALSPITFVRRIPYDHFNK